MSSAKRFEESIAAFLGRSVSVETTEGRIYRGQLEAVDERLNLILYEDDRTCMILNGTFVKEVKLVEKPLDIHALAERLGNVFPGLVKVRDDAIVVMDKIKVTERGVVEGSGLAAEKVRAIYEEFASER
jgi:small nuclear ribonucleoprotein (snRNP)-like protein